jgi:hypothetical protein
MAKVKSIIHIEGSIDNLVFYKLKGIPCVRRKDGKQSERVKKNPNFVRTRESNSEFGHCSGYGKVLRNALGPLLIKAKDDRLVSRMQQVLSIVKDMDLISPRGQRKVGIGLQTEEGKKALKGFDFNCNAPLSSVLKTNWQLATDTGTVQVSGFVPGKQLVFPSGATHVSFQAALLHLDFVSASTVIAYSLIESFPLDTVARDLILTPGHLPAGADRKIILLAISFLQEVNGVQYPFKNEKMNVLHILEVV